MTQKVVEKKEPQLVLESPDMREFYAEVAAITGYNTPVWVIPSYSFCFAICLKLQ
jgi:hypothetical protein